VQIIAILIGLVLLAAIAFYVSRPIVQQRRGGTDATVIATLESRRDAVYSQIRELDMDHATGKLTDEDYQQSRADLIAQATTLLKQIDGVLTAPIVPASIAAATLPAGDDVEALIAARRKASSRPAAVQPAPAQSGGDDVEAAIAARRKTVESAPIQADGDDIEAAIAARRKKAAVAPPPDDVEARIAARRLRQAQPAVSEADDIEAQIAARRKPVKPAAAAADDVEAAIAARRKAASPAPLPTTATCPTCGKSIAPDDVFCSKCGTPLKAAAR
jgi:hypothetical protein